MRPTFLGPDWCLALCQCSDWAKDFISAIELLHAQCHAVVRDGDGTGEEFLRLRTEIVGIGEAGEVATEMALTVLAYNLTRVMNIMGVKPLIAAMRA